MSDQKNLSACTPVTGPYLNFPEPLKNHTYQPLLMGKKTENPDIAVSMRNGLPMDTPLM
ncbi:MULTISPECIES: hypothetical protein [unclassified Methanosarcina]|uniref:hypothetical protein n=1 Tax=unclassified Methanosarcina TaxID=2644672 RepID=UPI000B2EF598|nr:MULTISPECIES: hypothetical protein [unclassified Methanosarcina]